jgi:glutamate formiminotransferase/glutamate formiminotransferase/formiminotetrahydrofolate cyclodeaminase
VAQFSLVQMSSPLLLAVPNVSEGRDAETIDAVGQAFASETRAVRLLDVHSDADHHRSVYTLAGHPGELAEALVRGAAAAVRRIDVSGESPGADSSPGAEPRGQHPYVGALDVAPVVYLEAAARGAACAEALLAADRIGSELEVPVFLYGELAGGRPGSTRAELRRGGVAGLAGRMAGGEGAPRRPDFGPGRMHPTAGATLIAAREPLVAFNVHLSAPATVADAGLIAALIREGGADGLPGVRAIGVALGGGVAQVSMNLERPLDTPLALVLHAVRVRAEALERPASILSAELVGLAPRAALEGFPQDVPLPGFDPARHVIENAVGENSLGS